MVRRKGGAYRHLKLVPAVDGADAVMTPSPRSSKTDEEMK
jgi:hypothetical protein